MRTYYEALGGRAAVCDCGYEARVEAFRADCVVDALFGTGFHGMPDRDSAALIRLINGTECVIACNVRTVRMQMKRCQQLLDYLSRKKEEDSGHPLKLL